MSAVRLFAGTRKGLCELESDESRAGWTVGVPVLVSWEISDVCVDDRADPQLLAAVG